MANECKMEFYFKRADIEKLLMANPKAKGIIISHEIVQEKPRGSLKVLNLVRIKARVDPAPKKKAAPAKTAKKTARQTTGRSRRSGTIRSKQSRWLSIPSRAVRRVKQYFSLTSYTDQF
jgi:hypothetical protein